MMKSIYLAAISAIGAVLSLIVFNKYTRNVGVVRDMRLSIANKKQLIKEVDNETAKKINDAGRGDIDNIVINANERDSIS